MNHSPGTLIVASSWTRPPLYQAGSLGARCAMRPPVATGIASAKIPFGPSIAFMMSCIGRCHSAFDQSTSGCCGARSKYFDAFTRSSRDMFAGNIGRSWFCSP